MDTIDGTCGVGGAERRGWRWWPFSPPCSRVANHASAGSEVLTIDLVNEPATLDPHMQANHDSFAVYRNVFDNLLAATTMAGSCRRSPRRGGSRRTPRSSSTSARACVSTTARR